MAKLEDILELSTLINRYNLTNNVQQQLEDESLYSKFFNLISSRVIRTDEEAIKELYGTLENKSKYFKLKDRLHEKLLDCVLLLRQPSTSKKNYSYVYPLIYKQHSAVKILIGFYARNSGINLSEKLIKKTIEYGFTDLTIDLARVLRIHYSSISLDIKKYRKYNKIIEKYSEILEKEIIVEGYYCQLAQYFAESDEINPEVNEIAESYSREIPKYLNLSFSYRLSIFSFNVIIIACELRRDYEGAILWSQKALDQFKPHFLSTSVELGFKIKKIESSFRKKKYALSLKELQPLKLKLPKNSINWFIIQSYNIIINFHSSQYLNSEKTLKEVLESPYLERMPPSIKERWLTYEAYIYYLISIGELPSRKSKGFRLNKFLNQVPVFSKDKRGSNIPILIIQIIFLIQKRDYNNVIDRIEALKQYHRRYLRRKDLIRSNLFIKMLVSLSSTDFHRERSIHRAKAHIEELNRNPLDSTNQSIEIEVIPYTTLWGFVVNTL